MNKFLILQKCILERKENPFNKLTKDQKKKEAYLLPSELSSAI